jgi:hypothetical protein
MTHLSARLRLQSSAGASGPFTHTPTFRHIPMISFAALVRRALVGGALASTVFAPAVAAQSAQSAQVVVPDAHRFLSPGLQGFEVRRHYGFGHFITDSTLRAASGMRLANLLKQHIPSLIFGSNGIAGEFPISTRVCAGGLACAAPRCYVRVYLDGTQTFDGTPRMRDVEGVDISHLRTSDFSGIEYYSSASGLPAQYGGQNSDCGTLLLWFRET